MLGVVLHPNSCRIRSKPLIRHTHEVMLVPPISRIPANPQYLLRNKLGYGSRRKSSCTVVSRDISTNKLPGNCARMGGSRLSIIGENSMECGTSVGRICVPVYTPPASTLVSPAPSRATNPGIAGRTPISRSRHSRKGFLLVSGPERSSGKILRPDCAFHPSPHT